MYVYIYIYIYIYLSIYLSICLSIYIKDVSYHDIMTFFKRKAFPRGNLCLEHFKRQLRVGFVRGKDGRKWFIQGNDDSSTTNYHFQLNS